MNKGAILFNADTEKLIDFEGITDEQIKQSFMFESYLDDFEDDNKVFEDHIDSTDVNVENLYDQLESQIYNNSSSFLENNFLEKLLFSIKSKINCGPNQSRCNKIGKILEEIQKCKKIYKNKKNFGRLNNYFQNINRDFWNKELNVPIFSDETINKDLQVELNIEEGILDNEDYFITSNGIEVCVLVSKFIFIYKILMGVTILKQSHKRIDLNPNETYEQIVCYGKNLLVVGKNNFYIIKLNSKNKKGEIKEYQKSQNTYFSSDGVILLVIFVKNEKKGEYSYAYKIFLLSNGALIVNSEIKDERFKNTNFFLNKHYEIVTNGSCVIFYDCTGGHAYPFSLITGESCIGKEGNSYDSTSLKNILATCFDAINQCNWHYQTGEDGKKEFVQYYSQRFFDPFLSYDKIPSGKKHMIEKRLMHFYGLYNIPDYDSRKEVFGSKLISVFQNYTVEKRINDIFKENKRICKFLLASRLFSFNYSEKNGSIKKEKKRLFEFFLKYDDEENNNTHKWTILDLWFLRRFQFSKLFEIIKIPKLIGGKNNDFYSLLYCITMMNFVLKIKEYKKKKEKCNFYDFNNEKKEKYNTKYRTLVAKFIVSLNSFHSEIPKISLNGNNFGKYFFNSALDLLPTLSKEKLLFIGIKNILNFLAEKDNKYKNEITTKENASFSSYVNALFIIYALTIGINGDKLNWIITANSSTRIININKSVIVMVDMKDIYLKWKPILNRKIPAEIMELDSQVLTIVYNKIHGSSHGLTENFTLENKDLLISLDIMIYLRNKYRAALQKNDSSFQKEKKKLLMRLYFLNSIQTNFKENDDKKLLIISFFNNINDETLLNLQNKDFTSTNLIKAGLNQLISLKSNSDYLDKLCYIIASQINSFELIKIYQDEEICKMIEDIIFILLSKRDENCATISYQYRVIVCILLIKSCKIDNFNSIINNFIDNKNLCKDKLNYFIFHVFYIFLINLRGVPLVFTDHGIPRKLDEIQRKDLLNFTTNDYNLLHQYLNREKCPDTVFQLICDNILKIKECQKHAFNFITTRADEKFVIKIAKTSLEFIGSNTCTNLSLLKGKEMVSLVSTFKNALNNKSFTKISKVFNEIIEVSDESDQETWICGILSILSVIDNIQSFPNLVIKLIKFFTYGITFRNYSSGILAISAVNNCLIDSDFCNKILKETNFYPLFKFFNSCHLIQKNQDIIESINKKKEIKNNNNQINVNEIGNDNNDNENDENENSENEIDENKLFNMIKTQDGVFLITSKLNNSGLSIITIKSTIDEITICSESKHENLFNVISFFLKEDIPKQVPYDLTIDSFNNEISISSQNKISYNIDDNYGQNLRLVFFIKKENQKFKLTKDYEHSIKKIFSVKNIDSFDIINDFITQREKFEYFNTPLYKELLDINNIKKVQNKFTFKEIIQSLKQNCIENEQKQILLAEKECRHFDFTCPFIIDDIIAITSDLKESIVDSYKSSLAESLFFITVVKMISNSPILIKSNIELSIKIFVLLILNCDGMSLKLLENNKFPFKLSNIIWDDKCSLFNEINGLDIITIQKVLLHILNLEDFESAYFYYIKSKYNTLSAHYPLKQYNKNVVEIERNKQYGFSRGLFYVPRLCYDPSQITLKINSKLNSTLKDGIYQLPSFISNTDSSFCVTGIESDNKESIPEIMFLPINSTNDWIFNTPFDFLILLKYLMHICTQAKVNNFIKQILLNSLVMESPFLSLYSIEFLKYFYMQHQTVEFNQKYIISFDVCYKFISLVPEKISHHKNSIYKKHFNIYDDIGFLSYFLETEKNSQRDALIINAFKDIFVPNNNIKSSFIDFNAFQYATCVLKEKELKEKSNMMGIHQLCSLFPYFSSDQSIQQINLIQKYPYGIYFRYWISIKKLGNASEFVSVSTFRNNFAEDLNFHMKEWGKDQTNELLHCFSDSFDVQKQDFIAFHKKIKFSNSLTSVFPLDLLLTNALILFHINCFFVNLGNEDKERIKEFIPTLFDFISPTTTNFLIYSLIPVNKDNAKMPRLRINRKFFDFQQCDNKEQYVLKESVLAQFSDQIKDLYHADLIHSPLPWKVVFTNEEAVDAGGPGRELMNEIANSIFDLNSRVVILAPKSKVEYIPFIDNNTGNFNQMKHLFYSIGVFIGIVVRTNVPQPIPFAPFVWKYIAGEKITESDITSIDITLSQLFFGMRNLANSCSFDERIEQGWKCTTWNGFIHNLKDDQRVKSNEVENYIKAVIDFRISSIKRILDEIRTGFTENIATKSLPINGQILSNLAQGSSHSIQVSQLKEITVYGKTTDPKGSAIQVFWLAVEKLTANQRTMLLRFITTQTRIPNKNAHSNFFIEINLKTDIPNGKSDEQMISAGTCFNKLYLPTYSSVDIAYDKIVKSIEWCPSMEKQ